MIDDFNEMNIKIHTQLLYARRFLPTHLDGVDHLPKALEEGLVGLLLGAQAFYEREELEEVELAVPRGYSLFMGRAKRSDQCRRHTRRGKRRMYCTI